MTALWTALVEGESKESLATMLCEARAELADKAGLDEEARKILGGQRYSGGLVALASHRMRDLREAEAAIAALRTKIDQLVDTLIRVGAALAKDDR